MDIRKLIEEIDSIRQIAETWKETDKTPEIEKGIVLDKLKKLYEMLLLLPQPTPTVAETECAIRAAEDTAAPPQCDPDGGTRHRERNRSGNGKRPADRRTDRAAGRGNRNDGLRRTAAFRRRADRPSAHGQTGDPVVVRGRSDAADPPA